MTTDKGREERIIHLARDHSHEFCRIDVNGDVEAMRKEMWGNFCNYIKNAENITHVEDKQKVMIALSELGKHCETAEKVNYHVAGPNLSECPGCLRKSDQGPVVNVCHWCGNNAQEQADKAIAEAARHNAAGAVAGRSYKCIVKSLPVVLIVVFGNVGLLAAGLVGIIIGSLCAGGEATYVMCGRGGCRDPAPCPSQSSQNAMLTLGFMWWIINVLYLVLVFWTIFSDRCMDRVRKTFYCFCPSLCDPCPCFLPCGMDQWRAYS